MWLVILGVLLAGGGLAAVPGYDQYKAWQAERLYRSGNSDAKRVALRSLAKLPTSRSRRVIREALSDRIPAARVAAGNAVFVGGLTGLAEDLWQAAQRETDGSVRAGMIVAWSQIVGDSARQRLRDLAGSPDPYARFGAIKGMLRLGDADVAKDMFVFAMDADRFKRRDAQRELLLLAQPIGQMIGQQIRVPNAKAGSWSPQDVAELQAWWQSHVTPRLLKDYLAWRYDRPEYWKKVDSLLHEWHKRAPGFLRTAGEEGEEG